MVDSPVVSDGDPARAAREDEDAQMAEEEGQIAAEEEGRIAAEEEARAAAIARDRKTRRKARIAVDDAEAAETGSARAAARPHGGPERVLQLRWSRSGAPVFVVLGGLVMALFAYLTSIAPSVFTYFFLGFSTIATSIAYAISFGSEDIHQIAIDREGFTLLSVDGSSVTVPRGAFLRAGVERITTTTSNRGTPMVAYHVHLHKKDGGVIDLGARRDEEAAQDLARDLDAEIARRVATPEGEAIALPMEAAAILEGTRGVRVRREEGESRADYRRAPSDRALVLEWSLRPSHTGMVPAIFAPLGFASALYGFWLKEHAAMPIVGMAIIGVIELAMLVMFVTRIGRSQVLRVDARDLSIEQHRGGKCLSRKAIPLASIRAVDYSYANSRIGGGLTIRKGSTPKPALPKDAPSVEDAVKLVKDTLAYSSEAENVSLGQLEFGDKLRIDLALSAEIAQRTGRNESDV